MPRERAVATRSITVYAVRLEFSVDPRVQAMGKKAALRGRLMYDTVGWPNETIHLYREGELIGSARTDGRGYFRYDWTIPFRAGYPCVDHTMYAVHAKTGARASAKLAIAYPTRFHALQVPSKVVAGQKFAVRGHLQYQDVDRVWKGLVGRTVSIYYDNRLIGTARTGSGGFFAKTDCVIPTPGRYTLSVRFAGEGYPAALAALAGPAVRVAVPVAAGVALVGASLLVA